MPIPKQVQKYFLEMKNKMPSLSPIDKNWPPRPYLFLDSTHKELKRIFHLWRVKIMSWFSPSIYIFEDLRSIVQKQMFCHLVLGRLIQRL